MYKHFNNFIVNSYYEARLPKNYQKPGPSAPNSVVEGFLRDKYIHRKWVNQAMDADPVTLYKTNMDKYKKYVKTVEQGL